MAEEGGAMENDLYVLQAELNNTISKIMEMESRIQNQEQEVSHLEMIVKESGRFQDLLSTLERASGLEILSVNDEFLETRVISYVPTMQLTGANHRDKYEHELAIKLDTTTMTIEAVQLMPEDIQYEDLVAEVKTLSAFHEAPLLVNGGPGWGKQIFTLICKIRQRIYSNIFKNAIDSAKDLRYKLEYLPEENLVIATLPGPATANIAVPYGWPMPGFSFHLISLVPSFKERDVESTDVLLQCVDLANSSPESRSPDILLFLQAIERIYVSKGREVSDHRQQ